MDKERAAERLRLFLDSADASHWSAWLPTGIFYGVTTNPTLLMAAGRRCTLTHLATLVRAALEFDIEEVHVQTWGLSTEIQLERGRALAALDPRVVVKVPLSIAGLETVRGLHGLGIRTTFTALYASHQAVAAALARVAYAAPYLGRISDDGTDGFAEVVAMHHILRRLDAPTRLLVASIRTAADLARLAVAGLDTFTIGARVAAEMFADPRTISAIAAFEAETL